MKLRCGHEVDLEELERMGLPKALAESTLAMHEEKLCNIEPNPELVKKVVEACREALKKGMKR